MPFEVFWGYSGNLVSVVRRVVKAEMIKCMLVCTVTPLWVLWDDEEMEMQATCGEA